MKKLVLMAVFFSSMLTAQDLAPKGNKIYLTPNEIQIAPEGIFVLINHNWIQIAQLQSDASGIYVKAEQFRPWLCDRCQQWTTGWWVCEHCGNPK